MSIIISPTSEAEEVTQNIRTLLATPRGSVPMDRALGVGSIGLDDPMPAAKARLVEDIISAVAEHEPRAEVLLVSFEADDLTGRLEARVRFQLKSGGQAIDVRA